MLSSFPQTSWWPFQTFLYKVHLPFTVVLHCIYTVFLCLLWYILSRIYLANKSKKLMSGPPQGAEDAPGHAFLLQGMWCFHSPRTILRALALVGTPVGNPQSKQGTGMSFISCRPAPPALQGSTGWVLVPRRRVGLRWWGQRCWGFVLVAVVWCFLLNFDRLLVAFARTLWK